MNIWTQKSIELAAQHDYLDLLYSIYPMSVNLRRELPASTIQAITYAYNNRQDAELLRLLLAQDIFPIKDSYIAYLKRDKSAISRNPRSIERITNMLYQMSLADILERISAPKETNRQIGPLFKRWVKAGNLGVKVTESPAEMLAYQGNIVFAASDDGMMQFAKQHLGYNHDKGLDFIAKFNGTFVIAEAKFLSDFGGHQNAQYNDAISTMRAGLLTDKHVIKISILDGVLYIKGNNKMYKSITTGFTDDEVIISGVLLKDYLFSL